jgi:hypothetical protein
MTRRVVEVSPFPKRVFVIDACENPFISAVQVLFWFCFVGGHHAVLYGNGIPMYGCCCGNNNSSGGGG